MDTTTIGFIGQGFIGKNYADDFERRGFAVTRYALETPYNQNKDQIKECDFVFIAVPTPTTPTGFDDHIVREAIRLVGPGKVAIIKSTVVPGTTASIQAENPGILVVHSPEFLTETTAAHDAANPGRNIVGIPENTEKYQVAARKILSILPKAPYEAIMTSEEAELLKYGRNCLFYTKVIFINMLYDLCREHGADWQKLRDAMVVDPWIGPMHLDPIHKSGRGAGGHCFIKDFAAFKDMYATAVGDQAGLAVLESLEKKNLELLKGTNKDLDLLKGVYGERISTE